MSVFKSTLRTIRVRPGILTSAKLKLIIPILKELNEEAKKLEFESYANNQVDGEGSPAITQETINNAMPIRISVTGEDGEFLFTDTLESLQDHLLPSKISKVVIDNSSRYRQLAKIDPLNTFRVTFDFSTGSVLDFVSIPTARTANESSVEILGTNDNWVSGAYDKLKGHFQSDWAFREIIHKSNAYDFALWFGFVWVLLWYFRKLDSWVIKQFKIDVSGAFTTVAYICLFIVSLYFFRFLFNYCRWLFPYLELEFQKAKSRNLQRGFFGFVVLSILGPLVYEFFRWIF